MYAQLLADVIGPLFAPVRQWKDPLWAAGSTLDRRQCRGQEALPCPDHRYRRRWETANMQLAHSE